MSSIPPDVEARITDARVMAHLATCHEGRPHVAPVWFDYHDGVVELVTTGRKLEKIRQNPYVSLSIEQSTDGTAEWMVTLLGTAEVVEDREAFQTANRRINRKYGVAEDAWGADNTLVSVEVGSASTRSYEGE